ncbi:MAG: pyridoxal-dependent decarboxylase [Pseudomonadota bacterium]|nr:pyridoxal-dependent decarboxylase [Pseudomonadota bacterium]
MKSPSQDSFLADSRIVAEALEAYRRQSVAGDAPVINQPPLGQSIEDLDLASLAREGGLTGPRLSGFLDTYLDATTRLHHPAYMAHQVANPHYGGALGSLIDGFTNNPMAIYEMGPAASAIEYFVINWMLEKVGWQPAPLTTPDKADPRHFGGGVLTHGGSLANLTALIAARNRVAPEVWESGNPGDLALLAPDDSHYSIERAAGILGIGRNAIYRLEVDAAGAVIPDRLPNMLEQLRNDGRRPMALAANACSTAVGIYDPLQEIGNFCREYDIWLHVDGAHGASALLSPKHRHRLRGIEQADSLTWDAHKMLRTPALAAALLVRDHARLDNAFEQQASYLFHDKRQPGFDFIHRTVECTKSGMGLKLFMVLAMLGEEGLARYVERQYALTLKAWDYFRRQPDFETPVKPQSNILCFRTGDDDALQLRIRDQLNARGDFYLSTTAFNGTRYLRLALMNPDTGMREIERLTQRIRGLREQRS